MHCLHERRYGTALCSFYDKDDFLAGRRLVRRIALFCWNQRIPLDHEPDVLLRLPVGAGLQFLQIALPASRGQYRSICAACKASISVLWATRRLISARTTSGPASPTARCSSMVLSTGFADNSLALGQIFDGLLHYGCVDKIGKLKAGFKPRSSIRLGCSSISSVRKDALPRYRPYLPPWGYGARTAAYRRYSEIARSQ